MIASFAFSHALKEKMNKNSILFKIYDKLVYSKFREIFGSRVEKLVSGGAPLSKEIAQFFCKYWSSYLSRIWND